MLLQLLLIVILTLFILYYFKRRYAFNYWKQRNIPTLLERPHWFFGHFASSILGRKSFVDRYSEAHKEFKKRGYKLGGMYLMDLPILLVVDAELKKQMLQTDTFSARGIAIDSKNNPLSAHIFNVDGPYWNKLRRLLSPTVTSGKLKIMLPILEKHIDRLIKVTKNMVRNGEDIEYHSWLDRAGIDIIGHTAFGLECNTLESENQTFFEMLHRITNPKLWKAMQMLFFGLSSPANFITLLSSDQVTCDYFINLIKDTVEYRRKNNIKVNDFLQMLIDIIKDDDDTSDSGLTLMEITAQSFIFFAASYETTSRSIDFSLYALAKAQDEQDKLRESIQNDLQANNGEYNYDWLMNNERLDMVVKEAMRLYPPALSINRMIINDYTIEEMGVTIPKGINVVFSSFGFHHDPDNFDNPLEFRPERFSRENLDLMTNKPFITFGEGPRFCMGMRLAYLQSKITLAKIITNFKVCPSKKTVYPLEVSPITMNLLLCSKTPIYYNFQPL